MFSPEEFPHYNKKPNFDWTEILGLIYHEHMRDLAKKLLLKRQGEASKLAK
jgi:hypothetical protein